MWSGSTTLQSPTTAGRYADAKGIGTMKLIWIDLETTGLKPNVDPMLEAALVVTDEDLNVLCERSWVIAPSMNSYVYDQDSFDALLSDHVREMHTRSGLLAEVMGGQQKGQVEQEMLALVREHAGAGRHLLAGSSVHFDHGFIEAQMRELNQCLHYRHFDVSVLQRSFEFWCPSLRIKDDTRQIAHRALDDIRWSIHVAKSYSVVFKQMDARPM